MKKETKILGMEYIHRKLDCFDPEIAEAPDVLPTLRERENRYGLPLNSNTAKITDSEKKVIEALNEKGYDVYRGGWPDFLAINSTTRNAFFVEAKSNGDTLRTTQVHMHNLLLDFFHLHVTVVRAVSGYVPDFVDPEFDVEKYHAMQLDKCKKQHQEIIDAIVTEKQGIRESQEEYNRIFEKNDKTLKEMEKNLYDQKKVFDKIKREQERMQYLETMADAVVAISHRISVAFQSVRLYDDKEKVLVSLFERYAKQVTDDLMESKKILLDLLKKVKTMQVPEEIK